MQHPWRYVGQPSLVSSSRFDCESIVKPVAVGSEDEVAAVPALPRLEDRERLTATTGCRAVDRF